MPIPLLDLGHPRLGMAELDHHVPVDLLAAPSPLPARNSVAPGLGVVSASTEHSGQLSLRQACSLSGRPDSGPSLFGRHRGPQKMRPAPAKARPRAPSPVGGGRQRSVSKRTDTPGKVAAHEQRALGDLIHAVRGDVGADKLLGGARRRVAVDGLSGVIGEVDGDVVEFGLGDGLHGVSYARWRGRVVEDTVINMIMAVKRLVDVFSDQAR